MIGIIIAMKDEISNVNALAKDISVFESNIFKYYIFNKGDKTFVLTFSGIGKANAASCVTELINSFSISKVINIGSCGACDKSLSIFDIVFLENTYYLDVDASMFGYEIGQIPQEKPFFESKNNFEKTIKTIMNENGFNFFELNGATADSFIHRENICNFNKNILQKVSCIDMESTAISQISFKKNIETCFIKVISDNLYSEKKSNEEFRENIKKISNLITDIINIITNNL